MILGVRQAGGFTRRLGVECSSAAEALAAAGAGADIVLLDNLAPQVSPKIGRGATMGRPQVWGWTPKMGSWIFKMGINPKNGAQISQKRWVMP